MTAVKRAPVIGEVVVHAARVPEPWANASLELAVSGPLIKYVWHLTAIVFDAERPPSHVTSLPGLR